MAIQFLPILKVIAPYVAQIATSAIPAFTSKQSNTAKIDPVVAQQIEELQSAVTQNAESIHLLAENLQQALAGLEGAATNAKSEAETYRTLLFISLGFSIASFGMCIYLLMR